MANKQTSRGRKQNRVRVAGGQDYEVRYERKEDAQVGVGGEESGQEGRQQPQADRTSNSSLTGSNCEQFLFK
jgi:hypothetical protein